MSLKQITSRSNPELKALRKLKAGFGNEHIVVEGEKLIREALEAGLTPQSIWTDEDLPFPFSCRQYLLSAPLYRSISPTKTGNAPLAVFGAPELRESNRDEHLQGRWLLLDQIQDPGNAGALVRAAAAFGMSGILWNAPCVYPFHHACIRASAGTVFHLPQLRYGPLPDDTVLIGAEADGDHDMASFTWPDNMVLIMGNEGHGLSADMRRRLTYTVRIAIDPKVESLNVAGAAHILMYHLSR